MIPVDAHHEMKPELKSQPTMAFSQSVSLSCSSIICFFFLGGGASFIYLLGEEGGASWFFLIFVFGRGLPREKAKRAPSGFQHQRLIRAQLGGRVLQGGALGGEDGALHQVPVACAWAGLLLVDVGRGANI